MIAHVRGRLLEKHATRVVVEVGGLGLEIQVPLTASEAMGSVGEEVALHTVLVVREDALALYGFRAAQERTLFLKLIAVSGIGPKIALNALSVPSLAQLVAALRGQDLAFLTRLPGIGKKTAERMSLELKDGLSEFAAEPAEGSAGRAEADAVAALVSLGYTRPSAQEAVQRAARESAAGTDPETLIRTALQRLAGGKSQRS
jgi:Holliday junction DNA helicase RuvA